MTELNNELKKLAEDISRKEMLKNMLAGVEKLQRELTDRVYELDRIRIKGQQDVEKLEGGSLAVFFSKLFGQHEKKLEKEEEEAYAAAVKFDAAMKELEDVKYRAQKLTRELAEVNGAQARYDRLLAEKEAELKARGDETANQIFAAEREIVSLESQLREINEAIQAGSRALSIADSVLQSLKSAENWSTYDLIGGGLMADIAKHSHLDDAQRKIDSMQRELRNFRTELSDIRIRADLNVQVDGFDRFADYFFDNLFTDWAVKDKINRSQSQVSSVRSQIYGVLNQLSGMKGGIEIRRDQLVRTIDELVLKAE